MWFSYTAYKHQVEVLLVTFAELSGVPFLLKACNEACQSKLMDTHGQRNIGSQAKLDTAYDESIKQARREMGMDVFVPRPQHRHRTHGTRRRKRCSIMWHFTRPLHITDTSLLLFTPHHHHTIFFVSSCKWTVLQVWPSSYHLIHDAYWHDTSESW